jgi:hypothetical protein
MFFFKFRKDTIRISSRGRDRERAGLAIVPIQLDIRIREQPLYAIITHHPVRKE